MDVYMGFGLLSAGIVIVIFMALDGWLKKRNVNMRDSSERENHKSDDPEFSIQSDWDGEGVSPSRVIYEYSDKPKPSDFTTCGEDPLDRTTEEISANLEPTERQPMRSKNKIEERRKPSLRSITQEENMFMPPHLLIVSVMAKKESRFESYDLLQAITATGMQFGEMNIFHYYETTPTGKMTLFSLASANKPGDFDLNNIAEFSCSGLMLFMNIGATPDPQYALKLMLDTAERLTEDLDGRLCADPVTPWNEKLAWQYHQKIMHYKTASKHDNKTFI